MDSVSTTSSASIQPKQLDTSFPANQVSVASPINSKQNTTDPNTISPLPTTAPNILSTSLETTNSVASQPIQDAATYIDNTGGSFMDLLQEISQDPTAQQEIATEMHMDLPRLQATLATILGKINQGQITKEELSLLLTAPMIDEELIS